MNKTGFGFLRLPVTNPDDKNSVDFSQVNQMVDAYLEAGGRYFDTAYTYLDGVSEEAIRRCLVERHPRETYILADKLMVGKLKTPEACEKNFQIILDRCGVSYLDVFLLHWLNEENYEKAEACGAFQFLRKVKEDGRARKTGFSFHDTADVLDRILTAHPEVDYVQLQLNYLDWDSPGYQARLCYETAAKHGKPIIVMEPVRGGGLAQLPEEAAELFAAYHPDDPAARWALRFIQSLPDTEVVLSGMSSLAQMEENMQDMEPMTEEEHALCLKAADIIRRQVAVPCTACRYCTSGCPKNIPIPDYFTLFNEYSRKPDDDWKIQPAYLQLVQKGFGKASDCIGCGKCEKMCPQKIEIRRFLGEVKNALEW